MSPATASSSSGTTPPVQLLVEEAGGRCSTYDGALPAPDASFVSTNGLLHEQVVLTSRRLSGVDSVLLDRGEHRGLVDPVAGEAVELRREDVARVRRAAPAGTAAGSPSRSMPTSFSCSSISSSTGVPEPRAQPACEQIRLRTRPVHANRLAPCAISRPQRGEQRAPAFGPLPRDVGDHDRRRRAPRAVAYAAAGRPTRSSRRSAGRRSRRAARTRSRPESAAGRASGRNTGRSEISSGSTIDAGADARVPRSASSITSPQTARSPTGKQRSDSCASMPSGCVAAAARAAACATDGAPPCPASVSSAASATRAAPKRCASSPTSADSAAHRPPPSPTRSRASSRSISAIETSSPVQSRRRSVPPPRPAVPMQQLVRRQLAPTFPARSSGTTAGRAARRRRSRRRAPTAPRSRPHA